MSKRMRKTEDDLNHRPNNWSIGSAVNQRPIWIETPTELRFPIHTDPLLCCQVVLFGLLFQRHGCLGFLFLHLLEKFHARNYLANFFIHSNMPTIQKNYKYDFLAHMPFNRAFQENFLGLSWTLILHARIYTNFSSVGVSTPIISSHSFQPRDKKRPHYQWKFN